MSYESDPWADSYEVPPALSSEPSYRPAAEAQKSTPEKRHLGRKVAVLAVAAISAAGLGLGLMRGGGETPANPGATVSEADQPSASFAYGNGLDLTFAEQKIGPLPEAVAKNMNGAVAVASQIAPKRIEIGTGFKVDGDSIVTAGHVVKGEVTPDRYNCDYTQVRTSVGRAAATAERSAFVPGNGRDAAQVDIDPSLLPGFSQLPSMPLARELPVPGEVVYNVSRQGDEQFGDSFHDPSEPEAKPPSVIAGVVAAVNGETGRVEIINGIAPAYSGKLDFNRSGSSGSSWMNDDGEVFGIVSATSTPTVDNYNRTTPQAPIRGLPGDRTIAVTQAAAFTSDRAAKLNAMPPETCDGAVYPG